MATLTSTITGFVRSDLVDEIKYYPIPFTQMRVWDAMQTLLPAAAASDDAGLVTGTPGTHAPTIQGLDPGGTSITSKFAFEFDIPPEYVAGDSAVIRVSGKCGTTVADGACTVDFNAYLDGRDGTVGADIVATAPYSINSLIAQTSSFTITASTLTPGGKLLVVGTIAANDAGNLGAMIPTLMVVEMGLKVKG